MATFNWTISTLERDLQPADMDGAIIVSHWRCTASQKTKAQPTAQARMEPLALRLTLRRPITFRMLT